MAVIAYKYPKMRLINPRERYRVVTRDGRHWRKVRQDVWQRYKHLVNRIEQRRRKEEELRHLDLLALYAGEARENVFCPLYAAYEREDDDDGLQGYSLRLASNTSEDKTVRQKMPGKPVRFSLQYAEPRGSYYRPAV